MRSRSPHACLAALGLAVSVVLAQPSQVGAVTGEPAPDIASAVWLNGAPAKMADFRGKVLLVEFWTFGCYNCRNVEPYVQAWHRKYADQGLVVIGVHSPEFKYERDVERVRQYLKDKGIRYPVPIDNDFATWNRYGNRYWPAMYLIDKQGIVRTVRIGEGGYEETEGWIRKLLAE
ncbi:MAG: redoxin domain-containing protein [Nitrospirota bacterium]